MSEGIVKPLCTAFVATYLPRRCGIATFTHDLLTNLGALYGPKAGNVLHVLALNNAITEHEYPAEVRFVIRQQHKGDYREAAALLNLSVHQVILLQHEFGIFGGEDGSHIVYLLENLKKPVVTTLHTVLEEPTSQQREVLEAVCALSTLLVVQAERAIRMLTDTYKVPEEKIVMIHHGAPNVPFLDPSYYKDGFQAEGRRVILTFGLLSPEKGIEYAIEALADVVEAIPDLLYVVLGETHPEVKRRRGEEYRVSLEALVKSKGLGEYVMFHNRFVELEELVRFLVAADVYLTPYLVREQIVSGTLAYAVACGKAIISTPYWYAEELLAEGRGRLVPFRDSAALAEQLVELLGDRLLRNRLRKQTYVFGRQMVWGEVAALYAEASERAIAEYGRQVRAKIVGGSMIEPPALPEINLNHLRTLTDDTGVLQHAIFATPDRYHGYSTDDNARALLMTLENWRLFRDDGILPLMQVYLAFLNHSLDRETDLVRNFMSYDRRWLEEVRSEDSHGRTLWALGSVVASAPNDAILAFALRMFKQALHSCTQLTSPRAWAFSILGCLAFLRRFRGDREVREVVDGLSSRLLELFVTHSVEDWPWCEDVMTYDNARLPQALIAYHRSFEDENMLRQGLSSLQWLLDLQTDPVHGHLSLIGNDGWFRRGGKKARFDQQPLDATALIDACHEALLATDDTRWRRAMDQCFAWFLGSNDLQESLYDFTRGGCHDGLHPTGINQNQGGESTICWLLALHCMYEIAHKAAKEPSGRV
ncbi:MAG: glycosyl transferase family 1 [Chloroflexi bacterium B3_Chlor]|nr:MAG: glycosyl transferase family 1 [Chloroflexi bacterium B3_Chlor]